jgi:hypothetical protein
MEDIRKGTCPLCRHNEILQTWPEEAGPAGGNLLAAAHEKGVLGLNWYKPLGPLSAFVCRRCGFTQWFAAEPARIPVDEKQNVRLIKGPEPQGPYR